MYKVTNIDKTEQRLVIRGRGILVPVGKSIIIPSHPPEECYTWKVEEVGKESVPKKVSKEKSELQKLIDLKHVEDEIATSLLERFGSIDKIKTASLDEIEDIPGIGKVRAREIKKQLKEVE